MLQKIKDQLDLAVRHNLIVHAKYYPVANGTTTIVIRFLPTTADAVKTTLAQHLYTHYNALIHVEASGMFLSANVDGQLPPLVCDSALSI